MITNFNKIIYLDQTNLHNLYKKVKTITILSKPIKNFRIIYNIWKKEILVVKTEQQKPSSPFKSSSIIQKQN